MQLTIGFSPCPNDTFIFDALVQGKIDTGGLSFSVVMEDVEALNRMALQAIPDICKVSYAVWPLLKDNYLLLDAGSALGRGVGPLLIAKDPMGKQLDPDMIVALPGEHTTAHLLFSFAYPDHVNKIFLRYDQIEDFVLGGKGAGVIIHENRFTYKDKGLHLVMDLGSFWELQTGNDIPLGGIVIKKEKAAVWQQRINELIIKSIAYSRKNYPVLSDYVKHNAKEMSEEVMRSHIELYVNEFSVSLGEPGMQAVRKLEEISGRIR